MAKWKITRDWGHDPEPGSDRDFAWSFKITDGHDERQITVEWAARGFAASQAAGRNAIASYLDTDRPPRRLLVDRDGAVSVIES